MRRLQMKILFQSIILSAILFSLMACAALEKDNEPKEPNEVKAEVKTQLDVYRPLVKAQADSHGLMVMGGSIGDSALFSCLARFSGAADFDPAILFRSGQPIRHPDYGPIVDGKKTRGPISRDMVAGILYCLLDLHRDGDTDHALDLASAMIDFGKAHKLTVGTEIGWLFCTEEDRTAYGITDEDWFGRCWMTPSVVKDIYRVAKMVGLACDADCQFYSTVGANIPADKTGFERHLAVIATVRNGLVDGGINDNSLKIVLQKAAESQPRNGLYQAAYHLYGDGNQEAAFAALSDEALFPRDKLPTRANYCSDYLFQRDDDSAQPDADWLPCGDDSLGSEGRGIEWTFAACLALGECL